MIDCHTHHLRRHAVVNIDPTGHTASELNEIMPLRKGYMFSVGIHPWNVNNATYHDMAIVRALTAEPDVVAIGEAGLDTTKGLPSDIETQIELLKFHVSISEATKKPLILHIVKRFPEIIRLKKELRPTQKWVIHGFRGKPELAKELLRHGFYLSFGEKFNPESVALTPPERMWIETDESTMNIRDIRRKIREMSFPSEKITINPS